jgi:hypothetical protein
MITRTEAMTVLCTNNVGPDLELESLRTWLKHEDTGWDKE